MALHFELVTPERLVRSDEVYMVTVPGTDNHFIYVQQPTALVSFNDFTREYGLPNPAFAFSVPCPMHA